MISPYSSSVESGTCCEVSASVRIGADAGLVFWYDGGMIPCGSCRSVCAIAACTSCAAASMLRSSANCTTICVCPRLDVDVMLSMPAIVENDFSSGVATVAAIVCGAVPGRLALTVIVGKSTLGRSLTGSSRYAAMPNTRIATMTSVVMTGRLMNSVVKSMAARLADRLRLSSARPTRTQSLRRAAALRPSRPCASQRRPNHVWNSSRYV